jgi:hypothetical protein
MAELHRLSGAKTHFEQFSHDGFFESHLIFLARHGAQVMASGRVPLRGRHGVSACINDLAHRSTTSTLTLTWHWRTCLLI